MLLPGIPDSFKLAEVVRHVHEKRYATIQDLAIAFGQGDRWAKELFETAKEWDLLPQDMTRRQWLDLFPVTRRLTKEEIEDDKRRRKVARLLLQEEQHRLREEKRRLQEEQHPVQEEQHQEDNDGCWQPERRFADLSLSFILSMYKYKDLQTEHKRVVKEKLADKQRGVCAVCRKPFSPDRVPNLDHDHETGNVRGLLCNLCNMGLGGFKDSIMSLENAIKYLLEHTTLKVGAAA